MANTLTGLIPTLYESMNIVARELTGFIPAVARNSSAERAAVGETVRYPIVAASALEAITPGPAPAVSGDETITYGDMTISKSYAYPIKINGEESLGLKNSGQGQNITRDRFAQAFRTLANAVEADIAGLYKRTSRAFGTAGTTPFGSSFADAASVNKILDDNGCPRTGRSLIIDTGAALNMKSLSNYLQAQSAGGNEFRQGVLIPLDGLDIRQSAQVASVTKGAGSAYTSNTAGYAVGATDITLITGSGAINAGDVVTFAGDTNKYVVATGVAAPGVLKLAAPGLRQAIPTSATALTVGNNFRANLAFHRDAIQLVTRAPAVPEGGDSADDAYMLTDPISGLTFEIRVYRQYRQVKYEVCLAWGFDIVKPEFAGILLG
jgi:hypothetical protein